MLSERAPAAPYGGEQEGDRSYARDLNLDQIVAAIAGDREEHDLIARVLYAPLRDPGAVRYRQEIFRDLEDPALLDEVQRFAGLMREVRAHLRQLAKMECRYQREGWLLDAAAVYCDAVQSLARYLAPAQIGSRALLAFRAAELQARGERPLPTSYGEDLYYRLSAWLDEDRASTRWTGGR